MSTRIAVAFGVFALTGCFIGTAAAQDLQRSPPQNPVAKSGGMTDAKAAGKGGSPVSSSKNIFENLSNSHAHTRLVTAITAADLVDIFKTNSPLTVFAPTNAAFRKLPAGAVDKLLQPSNSGALGQILTYHVVAGRFEAADLTDGKKLRTVQGEALTVRCSDGKIMIVDANNDAAIVTLSNLNEANGVVHVIDTVLMPKVWSQFLPRQ